jgi:hypothetical protein
MAAAIATSSLGSRSRVFKPSSPPLVAPFFLVCHRVQIRSTPELAAWRGLRDRPPIATHHPCRLSLEAEAQIVALRCQTGWRPRSLSAGPGPARLDDLARPQVLLLLARPVPARVGGESV